MTVSTIAQDKKRNRKDTCGAVRLLAATAFWLLLWQAAAMWIDQEILLVSPLAALRRLGELSLLPAFWAVVGASFLRIGAGFVLAVATGSLLAALSARFAAVEALCAPLMAVVKATPVASFIILALVWIRTSWLSVFISFLMVTPMVYSAVLQAVHGTDRQLLEMARCFGFPAERTLRLVYLPSVLRQALPAVTTGLGFAWKSGVAAEVIGLPRHSIGQQLYQAKIYLETPDLFAWTLTIILLSVGLEACVKVLLRCLFQRGDQ